MSFGRALTMSRTIAISQLRSAAPWLNHLLTAAAAEVQLLLTPRPTTGDLAMLDTRLPLRDKASRRLSMDECQGEASRDHDTDHLAFCWTENISAPNLSYAAQYLA